MDRHNLRDRLQNGVRRIVTPIGGDGSTRGVVSEGHGWLAAQRIPEFVGRVEVWVEARVDSTFIFFIEIENMAVPVQPIRPLIPQKRHETFGLMVLLDALANGLPCF